MKKILICIAILIFAACPAQAQLTPQQALAVWQEVARPTELTSLPFGIKQSITPNAWVTAGRSVTVTTALLQLLDSESELYGVLAHEAAHVKLKHTNNAVKRQVSKFIIVTAMNSLFGSAAGNAAGIGTDLAAAGYSREQEIAADDFAVKLAFENGQDMSGLYRALRKMSLRHKTEPSGFNSHPPDDRRLLHIQNTMAALESIRQQQIPVQVQQEEKPQEPQQQPQQEPQQKPQQEIQPQPAPRDIEINVNGVKTQM